MPTEFKPCVSNQRMGKSETIVLKNNAVGPLLGLKIGSIVDGSIAGKSGVKLMATGGPDGSEIPMFSACYE
ncbi:MAG: S6e family ribosomal protein [Thermoproteota archaeon]